MTTPPILTLHFPELEEGAGPFPGQIVHRAHISASLDALFEVNVLVHSTDPGVDPHLVVGVRVELRLEGEPHVDRIAGVIRSVRQLTSLRSATGHVASYYDVVIAPPMFEMEYRRGRRIHQHRDAVGVVKDTLATYGSFIGEPTVRLAGSHAECEYVTQYDESDLAFAYRILAEDHLASYFDPTDGKLVIVDDTSSLTPSLPFRLPYVPPSNLEARAPAAVSLRIEDAYASGRVDLRDYDEEHPLMSRSAPPTLVGEATVAAKDQPFSREDSLTVEGYAVGRFATESAGDAIAKRDLVSRRWGARVIECETNLAIFPGTRFFVDDHPRADAGEELLVVSARITIDDGNQLPIGGWRSGENGRPRRSYSLSCIRVAHSYAPRQHARPRAIGPETAFVVGASSEGQVDVDEHGRVLVEFVWDQRDKRTGSPSRRVRVSQGWAGANRGFVTLPRIGDEVLIGYVGGDPDQPIVTGRVHNAVARTPLNLPTPDNTVSVWRSRTVGGDGYNQFLMDDQPGGERLEIRAEKTRTDLTQGDESSTVGGSHTESIGGDAKIDVGGSVDAKIGRDLDVDVHEDTYIRVGGKLTEHVGDSITMTAGGVCYIQGDTVELHGSGGASIVVGNGEIKLSAPKITIAAQGTVDIDGAMIELN